MSARGFSLLEVLVAMAILVVALAALLGHQGVGIQMADFSNRVSQATMLAQGKMLDVEYALLTDSMDALDDCEDGDFREEGFRKFEWKACAYKLEMSDGAGDALAQQVLTRELRAAADSLGSGREDLAARAQQLRTYALPHLLFRVPRHHGPQDPEDPDPMGRTPDPEGYSLAKLLKGAPY